MKNLFHTILVISISLSCNEIKKNSVQEDAIFIENEDAPNEIQDCINRKYDTFENLKINGVKCSEFNINRFIQHNRKPDSIVDGYYYYGKSNFLFDDDKLIVVDIIDEQLYFDDFLSIETSLSSIEKRFPCSFENRNKTEYKNERCDVVNLYDKSYNKIKIFITKDRLLGVVYMINESDFDEMN